MGRLGLGVGLAMAGLACGACGGQQAAAPAPAAPQPVAVSPAVAADIDAGYAAYGVALSEWGTWTRDAAFGERWCPTAAGDFVPYHTNGHWTAGAQGTPEWASDGPAWMAITTHHGWWAREGAAWCWIPGAEPTPARVLWRTGAGLAGWAPEPPAWVDDGDELSGAGLEWTFCLLGALLEEDISAQYLTGAALPTAAEATRRRPLADPEPFAEVGPSAASVLAARRELLVWAARHPALGVDASATAALPAASRMVPFMASDPVPLGGGFFAPRFPALASADPYEATASTWEGASHEPAAVSTPSGADEAPSPSQPSSGWYAGASSYGGHVAGPTPKAPWWTQRPGRPARWHP